MSAPAVRLALTDPLTGIPLSRLRSWVAVVVMLGGTTFMSLVVTAVSPVMHAMAEHFGQGGHGKLVAYGVATVPSIGIMIGGPVTGWTVGRTGTRNFLVGILTMFGLVGSAGLYVDNVWVLVATRFVLGITASGIVTVTLIMIGEYFTPEMRARMLGYQAAIGAAGALIIIQLSGRIADFGGWRAPFALYLLAIPMLLMALAIPRKPSGPSVRAPSAPLGSIMVLWPILLTIVALFVASFMSNLQISFLLAADGVAKPSSQSNVLAAGALMVTIGSAIYGPVRRRLVDRWSLRLSTLLLGIGIVTMALSHDVLIVALGCAIAGLGTGLVNPTVNNMLITRAAPEARGRALGLGYTARYAGDFLNPVIVQPLTSAFGIHAAIMAVGGAFAVGALFDTVAGRDPEGATLL